jgi:hypothetical protein
MTVGTMSREGFTNRSANDTKRCFKADLRASSLFSCIVQSFNPFRRSVRSAGYHLFRKPNAVPEFQFTIAEPTTMDELLAELRRLHKASSVFWEAFRTEEFVTPAGNGWSPAGNIPLLPAWTCGLAQCVPLL